MMKNRIFKIFKWTLITFILIIFAVFNHVYCWISTRYSYFFSKAEMVELANIVNKSPKLTTEFYNIYDKIHPEGRFRSMHGEVPYMIKSLFSRKRYKDETSPCRNVYNFLFFESKILKNKNCWKDEYKSYAFGWGINNYTTTEKCFDYVISHIQLYCHDSSTFAKFKKYKLSENDTITLSERSGAYTGSLMMFGKKLNELNEDEIIELMAILENPSLYCRRKDLLCEKILEYKELIK